jgi:hypothetical protein
MFMRRPESLGTKGKEKVPRIGIEPMTRGFSVLVSFIPTTSENFLSV